MKRLLVTLLAGALLVALPGGVAAAEEVFSGTLRGANEVPAVSGNGAGTAYVFINDAKTEVKYAVSYTGLSGPVIAAHIHVGAKGANGPIMLPLKVGPSTMFGTVTQADLQSSTAAPNWAAALNAIRTGRAYVNLHTSAHPAGEIRAQLVAAATASPSPTPRPTAAATPRPTATARPTAAATTRPTATPRPTQAPTDATAAPTAHTPPPTSTIPASGRDSMADLASLLGVLLVAAAAGAIAAWKLQPPRRRTDDWD